MQLFSFQAIRAMSDGTEYVWYLQLNFWRTAELRWDASRTVEMVIRSVTFMD